MTNNEIIERLAADLRALLASGKLVDVGKRAAEALNIKPTKMVRAVKKLEEEGHRIFYLSANQKGTNLQITMKVLATANATFIEVMDRRDEIVRLERLSSCPDVKTVVPDHFRQTKISPIRGSRSFSIF